MVLFKLAEYYRPQSIAEAVELIGRPGGGTRPLAGGTELNGRVDGSITAVVDLSGLGLDTWQHDGKTLRLGAMVTLRALAEEPELKAFARGFLAEAAVFGVPRTIRNAATIGGALAGEKGAPELLSALIALGAHVRVHQPEPVDMTVEAFFARKQELLPGALISEVTIPVPAEGVGFGLSRVARTPADRAAVCVSAAARWEDDRCANVRLGVGGLASVPMRLASVEQAVQGRALAEWDGAVPEDVTAGAVSDVRGSAAYRRWVTPILVRRALEGTREGNVRDGN